MFREGVKNMWKICLRKGWKICGKYVWGRGLRGRKYFYADCPSPVPCRQVAGAAGGTEIVMKTISQKQKEEEEYQEEEEQEEEEQEEEEEEEQEEQE